MANIDTLKGKLTSIANAIRQKTGRSALLDLDEMPTEILSIDGGNAPNPDDPLLLVDWDGTLLYSYTYEDAQLISEFPDPPTHEGLTFQNWNYAEAIAKTWLQNHRGAQLKVGATYTPTDGQDHNYWRSPRLSANNQIYMQHRATSVSSNEFYGYFSLTAISLPNSLTTIGNTAFQNCFSLTAISLPNSLTSIGDQAFYYCYSLTSVSLPNSLTSISSRAFYYCYSLTSVSLPNSLTSISDYAFRYCYALVAVILSNSLATISGYAFANCYSLYKMDIPASVTFIGDYAFYNCTSLVDVVVRGTPSLGGSNVFGFNPSNQRFYVHRSDLSWFETATNWSAIYGQPSRPIVAAADHIEYLQSIGIDTRDFEGE